MQNIIVVGGGAGGLSLASHLGRKLRRRACRVTLVDRNPSHLWKPLLHEVAAGTIDPAFDELNYRFQGKRHNFDFQQGAVSAVRPEQRQLVLEQVLDSKGRELIPRRQLHYDYLVLAVGGISNDFGVPGAKDYCYFLDDKPQAEDFHEVLLQTAIQRAYQGPGKHWLNITIVGGGATGVELAAELAHTARALRDYTRAAPGQAEFSVALLEAGPRILPALPEKLANAAAVTLKRVGVDLACGVAVERCEAQCLHLNNGTTVPSDLHVWATGVKAPDWLADIPGLSCNNRNQLAVDPTLLCQGSDSIFAIGDCASLALPGGGFVPPRAQAAHQMASTVYQNLLRKLGGKTLRPFRYRDFGSLVSLSDFNAFGSLLGSHGGELRIGGLVARIAYRSLYIMHLLAIHGPRRCLMIMLAGRLHRRIKPRLKLH